MAYGLMSPWAHAKIYAVRCTIRMAHNRMGGGNQMHAKSYSIFVWFMMKVWQHIPHDTISIKFWLKSIQVILVKTKPVGARQYANPSSIISYLFIKKTNGTCDSTLSTVQFYLSIYPSIFIWWHFLPLFDSISNS